MDGPKYIYIYLEAKPHREALFQVTLKNSKLIDPSAIGFEEKSTVKKSLSCF